MTIEPKKVNLSACCHTEIGYDAWVDSNGDICGGPFDASMCMLCGGEDPDLLDEDFDDFG